LPNDEKSGLTYKAVNVSQIPQLIYSVGQMDALTKAKINVLRNDGIGNPPVLLHDMTAATDASDYTNLIRTRCMGMLTNGIRLISRKFLGEGAIEGRYLSRRERTALARARPDGAGAAVPRALIPSPRSRSVLLCFSTLTGARCLRALRRSPRPAKRVSR
jgi:hypothetical protein